MKLKRLWIDGFRNLNDFELNFENNDRKTVLIGNNGSGKSNILEALCIIFYKLYYNKKINDKFNYEIEYIINEKNIKIEDKNDSFSFTDSYGQNLVDKKEQYLPVNIIMLYTGEKTFLNKNYFSHSRKLFLQNKDKNTLPKMIYLNSFFWNISLLSLLKEKDKFISENILNNNDLKEIKIYLEFNEKTILNDTSIMKKLYEENNKEKSIRVTVEDFFDHADKINMKKDELFIYLWSVVGLNNKISKFIIYNNKINTTFLSEGQQKLILVHSIYKSLATKGTLVLMDEPDNYMHITNKIQIKNILDSANNIETILTTHSPTLTHSFEKRHITMLKEGQIEDGTKQEIFAEISDGIWSYQEQNIFLSSSKEIILLVEGKHDKAHIQEAFKRLESEYESLEFDIFYADGANNLKQLVLGFSTTDFDLEDKKIIAIFDNDKDGRNGRGNNFKKVENSNEIYCLKSNKSFYGILLPKQDDFSGEFTIENMYPSEKYKEALNNAFQNRQSQEEFFKTGINEISKKIKEDAKNLLMNSCKDFIDDDFEHFKKLFDLIVQIKDIN